MSSVDTYTPRLQKKYNETVVPILKKELGLENVMSVPKLDKVVLNMGVGEATQNKRFLEDAVYTLTQITGQKPIVTKAKNAISNFKLREDLPIGCKVTLRGAQMYEFLDRLVGVTLPRVKDFRGVSKKSFDGHGNYSLGFQENTVFMEVDRDKILQIQGLEMTICTTADNNDDARLLLATIGIPFRK